jgi:hypothetical protein
MGPALFDGACTLRRLVPRVFSLGIIGIACASTFSCGTGSEVRRVYTALDTTGDRTRTEFYTDTTQFACNVDYVGAQRNSTVYAVIRRVATLKDSDKPGEPYQIEKAVDDVLVVGEAAPALLKGTIGFQISRPKPDDPNAMSQELPFPRGLYDCEIYVNKDPLPRRDPNAPVADVKAAPNGVARFAIRWPPGECPVGYAKPGTVCAGYWPQHGTQCRGQGFDPLNPGVVLKCVCGMQSGLWECQ